MTLVDALRSAPGDTALIYDTFNAASASASAAAGFLFDNATAAAFCDTRIAAGPGAAAHAHAQQAAAAAAPAPRRKGRRRARICKSREETESQRMTHIAVERNRRRQMNEYLAVLRSLMPESYVQRGDQASIVGGAIEFVKELEQQLQSLEAQKRRLVHHHKAKREAPPLHAGATACVESSTSNCSSSVTTEVDAAAATSDAPPFAHFFTFPQYVWCQSPRDSTATATAASSSSSSSSAMAMAASAGPSLPAPPESHRPGVADVEVNLVETHASVRVMSPRRPGQLLKMIAGLQALRLAVLHLNVTALDSLVLYSLSLKVEEGCGLTTADDVAAAVHHVLRVIGAEEQLLAAVGQ